MSLLISGKFKQINGLLFPLESLEIPTAICLLQGGVEVS